MSKKIGNAMLIKRMQNRFSTTDLEPEILKLSETVIPVTQADEALKKLKEAVGSYSISATGGQTIFTCPSGKRCWLLQAAASVNTGTYTMNRVTITSPSGKQINQMTQTTAAAIRYLWQFPLYIDRNWKVEVGVDVYSVTGNLDTVVWYLECDGDNE